MRELEENRGKIFSKYLFLIIKIFEIKSQMKEYLVKEENEFQPTSQPH